MLQDPKNRWMPSRGVWNQHTYHITNINDDLTVPQKETPSWTGANSYRQNVQGEGTPGIIPGPDLTGGWASDPGRVLPDCSKRWPLRARICNRGAARVVRGVLGTFSLGDPQRGGKPICTAHTASEILPGECALVGCDYESPPAGEIDLWFVVDRSASGESAVAECQEENNTLHLPRSACHGLE